MVDGVHLIDALSGDAVRHLSDAVQAVSQRDRRHADARHTKALIKDTINETAKRLSINVDWELYVAEEREVSIDIMVPFQFSDGTSAMSMMFGMPSCERFWRNSRSSGSTSRCNSRYARLEMDRFPTWRLASALAGTTSMEDVQDYTSFFRDLHLLSRVEEDVRSTLDAFFSARPMMHLKDGHRLK